MIVSITGEPKITIRVHDADLHSEPSIEIARLRARVAELEAALEPFAERMDVVDELAASKYACGTNIEIEHLRRARAVLNKERKDG